MKIAKQSIYNGQVDQNLVRSFNNDLRNVILALSGRVRFGSVGDGDRGENISGEWQTFTSNGSADTEDTIAHTLGSVPEGFIVTNINKGGVVYDSGTSWTSSNIYLKTSVSSATVTIFLLK